QVAHAQAGPPVHRFAGDVAAVEHDAAGVGRHQADDHVETGGLAGAVRAEQADDLAGVERQSEFAYHLALAVALAQALGDQHQLPSWSALAPLGRMRVRTWPPSSPPPCTRPVAML